MDLGSSMGPVTLVCQPGTFWQRKTGQVNVRMDEATRATLEEIKSACGFSDDAEYPY